VIKKFKRVEVIEAIQFLGTKESFDEIRAWVGEDFYYDYQVYPRVFLRSEEKRKYYGIDTNDWVVRRDGVFSGLSQQDMDFYQFKELGISIVFKND